MKHKKSPDSKPKRTKKAKESNPSNGIDKSQRLLRSQTSPQTPHARGKRASDKTDKRNGLGLVCGKPMPPLSELEKMYDGSDEEMPETTSAAASANIKAPEEKSTPVSNGAITPTTAKKYADEILKILNGEDAPQPIIPMKKYKKPEVPYIVGCTERERIPENPNCNVFKGDDYGITSKTNALNGDEDQGCSDTPGFYMNPYSLSKSIFNAQANEIASKLLSNENNPIVGGSDSEDTMIYELNSPIHRFSPVPSTSKDCETISKNDQKFIESFVSSKKNYGETNHTIETFSKTTVIEEGLFNIGADLKNPREEILKSESGPLANTVHELVTNNVTSSLNSGGSDDDIEIIEQPCETIEINDEVNHMDVKTKPCTYVKSENNRINKLDMIVDNILDDDICEIIDIDTPNANIKRSNKVQTETIKSPIVLQKYYNPFDPNIIAEIDLTNVDDVISENQSIIDKYSKHNILSSVNLVETNVARPESVENTNKPKNVASMQFGSKNNQTNTDQTTKHNQFFSSELEKIVKDFFNKRGNTSCPHNQAIRPLVLHGSEKMFPVCSLNNSLNNPIQRNFPELSLNNSLNNPIQRNFPELSLNNSLSNPIQRNFPELSLNNSLNNPIQRNFPELSLNNSLNNPIQRNFPELFLNNSLSPNKQSKRKRRNKDKSQNKADNNINPSTTNLFNVNNNVETPSQPSLGTCPICLDDLTRERVGSTNCGHLFCMPCLSTALKTKPKRCPTCRKKLTGLGYHQIFV